MAMKKKAAKKRAARKSLPAFYFRSREAMSDGEMAQYRVEADVPGDGTGGHDFSGYEGGVPDGAWSLWGGSGWAACDKPEGVRHTKRGPE